MLNGDQTGRLEALQSRALKTIYGWNHSYQELLEMSGLDTLEERRNKIFDEFARKSARNPRFAHWFPPSNTTGHDTRIKKPYLEEHARTERYKKSPVFKMRERLNAMNQKDQS